MLNYIYIADTATGEQLLLQLVYTREQCCTSCDRDIFLECLPFEAEHSVAPLPMFSVEEQKLYLPPVHLGKTVGEGRISLVEVVEGVVGMHP